MKLPKKSVQILLDKKNDWIYKYFNNFKISKSIRDRYKIDISNKLEKTHKKEILFIVVVTKKLSLNSLSKYKKKLVIHESNLPKGRGFSPIKKQILKKIYKIKCCLIECDEKIDGGDIYETEFLHIKKNDLYDDIRMKQYETTLKLINKFLKKYPNVKSKKQKGKPSYFRRLKSKDDEINPSKNIISQFDLLRSTDYKNHQNFFYINKKKYLKRISKNKI